MRIIADLHLHSKYSRSCSKDLTLYNIAKACEVKGIQFVGTSDALHPEWRKDISLYLEEKDGALYLKDGSSKTAFCLTTEVSCIYKRHDKTRRLHHVIIFPDLDTLDKVIKVLSDGGYNLKSDGRPILGLDSELLLKILLDIDERILLIPAHAWTPWFAIFGSKSGFDSLEECFGDYAKYIYAIETGLSSDPPMNWRLSRLDNLFLISNSDAHSTENLGREANVFEMERPSTEELRNILVNHDLNRFIETIEFFPEEGKYHADGHADCNFWCDPQKTKALGGRCPKCGKLITVGVLTRIQALADRAENPSRPDKAVPFKSIIPLKTLISDCIGKAPKTKSVAVIYDEIVKNATEFDVLLYLTYEEMMQFVRADVLDAIMQMRKGEVDLRPGYDGVFGKIKVRGIRPQPKQQDLF